MIIIFLGPQGSGKGTQAKLLVEKNNLQYFEAGDVLRQIMKEDSSLGREIDRIMNQEGTLVPAKTMGKIVDEWLTEHQIEKGIVYDGYPRNIDQYQTLKELLAKRNAKVDKVVYLGISRKESLTRLSARRICSQCDLEFNLITKPPKKDELCDRCQSKLIQRKDDTPEMIEARLNTYYSETQPLIDQFRQEGILEEIDGERSIETIHQEILARLEK